MSFDDVLSIIPGNPVLSGVVLFLGLSIVFYVARIPAHQAILQLTTALYRGFRIGAKSILRAEKHFAVRNREVLLAHGREEKERLIEREFERIDAAVRRDLADVPALHRRVSERITKIEEDHTQSTDVPPTPPGWVDAVKAVANISSKGDPMVGKILEVIHSSLVKAHAVAVDEYRKSTQLRHKCLQAIVPEVRKLDTTLNQVDKDVVNLLEKSRLIDQHMDDYDQILKKTDKAQRMLSTSAFTNFLISAVVLGIAAGGAMINFKLIARPMAEMVGGGAMIGGLKTADIAALVIILVEVSMGLFLMESLRITRLFPVIGALKDSMRIKMVWITLTFLTLLAAVEAGLAFMREILVQDELATSAMLRGTEIVAVPIDSSFGWITTAAQMGLGFILPFALAFVAIPAETFVHTARSVMGTSMAAGMRGFAALLRITGTIFRHLGMVFVHIYDVFASLPLGIEYLVKHSRAGNKKEPFVRREPKPSLPREAA